VIFAGNGAKFGTNLTKRRVRYHHPAVPP